MDKLDLLFGGFGTDGDCAFLGLILIERYGIALNFGDGIQLFTDHLEVNRVNLGG
jgi:hypothetical protein